MKPLVAMTCFRVIFLTPAVTLLLSGCALVRRHLGETCNSHAYVQSILADHISQRFGLGSPVRLAIIPFSTPANVASRGPDFPGLGEVIAQNLHGSILRSGAVPIVEILNRKDWPGKKEEFFTGNFGAIAQAREAGYDLVLVGYVEPRTGLDVLSAYSKLVDVDSGITVWYGRTQAQTIRGDLQRGAAAVGLERRRPDLLYSTELTETLSNCIASDVLAERMVPE